MTRGGQRAGAGRKSRFGVPTSVVRVPVNMIADVRRLVENPQGLRRPLYSSRVSAGFPTPADDHIETYLDLNEYLIDQPSATFFVRASGHSMTGIGIFDGDLLIVDRSKKAENGSIVIVALDGELTVKRLLLEDKQRFLMSENPDYAPIPLKDENELHLWGVVTSVVHPL